MQAFDRTHRFMVTATRMGSFSAVPRQWPENAQFPLDPVIETLHPLGD
jgi:hypothetical protein